MLPHVENCRPQGLYFPRPRRIEEERHAYRVQGKRFELLPRGRGGAPHRGRDHRGAGAEDRGDHEPAARGVARVRLLRAVPVGDGDKDSTLRLDLRGQEAPARATQPGRLVGRSLRRLARLHRDQKVTDQERYKNVLRTLRWIAQREVIFGQHVHVAVPGPEEAIIAHNRLAEQTPILLALSTNSPFWQGFDTGFESSRVKIFESFPRAGLPPAFPDYEAFEDYVDLMVESGAMEDYTFCWWDVRPHPKIGTIELRVLDSQTSLKDTLALTSLTQCLVAQILEEVGPHEPYNMHLAVENKFRAARYGMDAAFYDIHDKITVPARDLARNLVERLKPHAQDLGCESELEGVLEIVEGGTGSQRQREIYKESGNFLDVVAFLIEGTRPALAEEQS